MAVTPRSVVSPVSGSVALTLSPISTSEIGLTEPSAISTNVSPTKLWHAFTADRTASAASPAPLRILPTGRMPATWMVQPPTLAPDPTHAVGSKISLIRSANASTRPMPLRCQDPRSGATSS